MERHTLYLFDRHTCSTLFYIPTYEIQFWFNSQLNAFMIGKISLNDCNVSNA